MNETTKHGIAPFSDPLLVADYSDLAPFTGLNQNEARDYYRQCCPDGDKPDDEATRMGYALYLHNNILKPAGISQNTVTEMEDARVTCTTHGKQSTTNTGDQTIFCHSPVGVAGPPPKQDNAPVTANDEDNAWRGPRGEEVPVPRLYPMQNGDQLLAIFREFGAHGHVKRLTLDSVLGIKVAEDIYNNIRGDFQELSKYICAHFNCKDGFQLKRIGTAMRTANPGEQLDLMVDIRN